MYERPIVEVKNGEIKFNLFPKQAAFVHSDVDDVFYGGSVGGGKTAALLSWAGLRRLQFPMSNGILFRRTFRELEGSLILKSKEMYRPMGAIYNENKKCWTFPNGATQFFGFCDSDGDVYQYMTNEYNDMGFDELTHFTNFQFNYLAGTRTRSSIAGMKVQIRSASNPGNIGNDWVRKRYIIPSQVSKIWTDPETNKSLSFIPAWLSDNAALMENDPGYKQRLMDLKRVSEKKYLALAEGRWDQPEGVYFCYDDKTDILTSEGWRNILEVKSGDSVATLSPEKELIFASCRKSVTFDFDGEMFEYKKQAMNFCVTPKHRMYSHPRRSKIGYGFLEIENLPESSIHLRTALKWKGKKVERFSLERKSGGLKSKNYNFEIGDWLELLGWYLSEGSICKNSKQLKNPSLCRGFSIAQSFHKDRVEKIAKLLGRMGLASNYRKGSFYVSSTTLGDYFHKFRTAAYKFIPREFLELEPCLLMRLFESLMLGDGHLTNNGTRIYATISRQLADDIQELCLRIGKVCTITRLEPKKAQHSVCYILRIYKDGHTESLVHSGDIKKVPYRGKVGCVIVDPHHTVFVRRGGRAMWCGNTEWTGEPGHNVLPYRRIPDSYTMKFLSLDWGFSDPACVLWWEVTPLGRVFIYREYYGSRLSPKELAEKILSMSPEGEKYMYMAASPEIWGKRVETDNGGEVIQQLIQAGLGDRIIMQKANNARIPGWLKIREYLSSAPDGKPWLQISPNCENLIRTLPSLIHDDRPGHAEDVAGRCEDHAPESCRYGISSIGSVPKSMISPHMTGYEKIFGVQRDANENFTYLPDHGTHGYGR